MNKKEKTAWITKEILKDQRTQAGEIFNTVKYGNQNLKPSFWLNEDWAWSNLKKKFVKCNQGDVHWTWGVSAFPY